MRVKSFNKVLILFFACILIFISIMAIDYDIANAVTFPIPSLKIGVEPANPDNPEQVAIVLEIIALLTIIGLAPSILILMTPFTLYLYSLINPCN
ncbi:flagellar biosynthetic protein FliP [Candidatus Magnetoovum chiemensis]|nr:flagellar biosynthetic protein FliP [Candidatus Magnetoovum chiemensis]